MCNPKKRKLTEGGRGREMSYRKYFCVRYKISSDILNVATSWKRGWT